MTPSQAQVPFKELVQRRPVSGREERPCEGMPLPSAPRGWHRALASHFHPPPAQPPLLVGGGARRHSHGHPPLQGPCPGVSPFSNCASLGTADCTRAALPVSPCLFARKREDAAWCCLPALFPVAGSARRRPVQRKVPGQRGKPLHFQERCPHVSQLSSMLVVPSFGGCHDGS